MNHYQTIDKHAVAHQIHVYFNTTCDDTTVMIHNYFQSFAAIYVNVNFLMGLILSNGTIRKESCN